MFPDNLAAERWFETQRWRDTGRFCPDCGSRNTVVVPSRNPMPYRCRDCRSHFSVRKGTIMQSSKLGLQKWLIAIHMMTTGLRGTSSMTLHRELGIRQATAWFLMQRIRESCERMTSIADKMTGPAEAGIGGKEGYKPADKKLPVGHGTVGKTAGVGTMARDTNAVSATVVKDQ